MGKVLMQVVRSYWPEEDKRVPENIVVEMEAEQALKYQEDGVVKRAPVGAKLGDIIEEPAPPPIPDARARG
jgi:hypothetical protein